MESLGDKGMTDSFETSTCSSNLSSFNGSSKDCCSTPTRLGWPIRKAVKCVDGSKDERKLKPFDDGMNLKQIGSTNSEMELMKERFAKLLLGEDMSGSGKGVCTALAISNAITNLCATAFGQLWRLEPLQPEKKQMWQREMDCLLCVSDHIVELIPSWQTFPDGSKLEVMTCRPRSDIFINLPALRKLDNMLLEILDGFKSTEFWYVDQGIVATEAEGSGSFRKPLQRHQEKWWLPVPRVPSGGLRDDTRKQLTHKRECANQILKAAMAINSGALAEMEVPESYYESLPKNGRACLGDVIYRYITSEQFTAECLLDCLDLSSEHVALDIANRVEASIYVWRKRVHSRPNLPNPNRSAAKASWDMVKDLMADGCKRDSLADRAESLLLCLKHRFPGLTQTALDISKIQHNKDVGKSILESYSRVLESLSFNIVARIDDLLYVDDLTRQSDNVASVASMADVIAQKRVPITCIPSSGTPYKSAFATPKFSPGPVVAPGSLDRTPALSGNCNKPPRRGFGVKRALTSYLGGEIKAKSNNNYQLLEGPPGCLSTRNADMPPARSSMDGPLSQKENRNPKMER